MVEAVRCPCEKVNSSQAGSCQSDARITEFGGWEELFGVCPNPDVFLLILFRSGQGGHRSEREKFPERESGPIFPFPK